MKTIKVMTMPANSIYFTDEELPESYSLKNQIYEHLEFNLAKDKTNVTKNDVFRALAYSVRDKMVRKWLRTQNFYKHNDIKKVHYLSLEFLMGRLLENSLINLGFYNECKQILKEIGYDLTDVLEEEHDMGLGNGGLGRLASCFLDSMATLKLPANGYGIRYEYGIFHQEIEHGYQKEKPDNWIGFGNPWEVMRPELTYTIKFYGRIESQIDKNNRLSLNWVDTDHVLAVAYDIPIPGYNSETVNNLRLWQAKAAKDFDLHFFNMGDYVKAVENKNETENISKVLYPNDKTMLGKELRLKQQYFFVSASLQDIIRSYKETHTDFDKFSELNAIQLNDTHPAIAIPELMRLLIDEENLGWEEAWEICQRTFGYTNHTVLSEALEKWSVKLFEKLLPRHLQIIYEINYRFLDRVRKYYHNDIDKLRNMSIIEEGHEKMVRMANLAIVASHSVNGVAALHTKILKDRIFYDFNDFYPEKINNKTNGITQRRWLRQSNQTLSKLISSKIGDSWVTDLYKLKELENHIDNTDFIYDLNEVKKHNKLKLADFIKKEYHITVNPDSIFDTQIKRIHEYKRQLLNVLKIITLYNRIKEGRISGIEPHTYIFGGKAAPGYYKAKMIIKLINSVAGTINNDPDVNEFMKVVFMKNYSVSLAEIIIPATDLSEQISTAGYEASGTGNMKFQLNGSLTVGTLDGANIEMMEEMGRENIFIFGLDAEEVARLKLNGYNPYEYFQKNEEIAETVNLIKSNYFEPSEAGIFDALIDDLIYNDSFLVLADFQSYLDIQDEIDELYEDKNLWGRKALLNIARVGKFSSDRTISQYADEIWKIKPVNINF
jgi:starch phosphorylase